MPRKKVTVKTDNSGWTAPKKRKPRKPMTEEQRAAAANDRLNGISTFEIASQNLLTSKDNAFHLWSRKNTKSALLKIKASIYTFSIIANQRQSNSFQEYL